MLHIIETRDSSFTVSLRENLSEKLQLLFVMLNQLQGVSGSPTLAKQGEEEEENIKNEMDPKDN